MEEVTPVTIPAPGTPAGILVRSIRAAGALDRQRRQSANSMRFPGARANITWNPAGRASFPQKGLHIRADLFASRMKDEISSGNSRPAPLTTSR
jgi:hypothetical protein